MFQRRRKVICAGCGFANPHGSAVCKNCDRPLAGAAAPSGDKTAKGGNRCAHCLSPLAPGALACPSCGEQFLPYLQSKPVCPKCKREFRPGDTHCIVCGVKLNVEIQMPASKNAETPVPARAPAPPPAPVPAAKPKRESGKKSSGLLISSNLAKAVQMDDGNGSSKEP